MVAILVPPQMTQATVTAVGRMLTPKHGEPQYWERIKVRQYEDGTYTAERYWLVPVDDTSAPR